MSKASKRRRTQEVEDIRAVHRMPQGRRLLYRILEGSGIWRSSYSQNSHDTSYNEGARNRGLWLLAELDAAGDSILLEVLAAGKEELKKSNAEEENENKEVDGGPSSSD